jgi:hypothetical protein
MAPSLRAKRFEDVVAAKVATKSGLYQQAVEANDEEFVVLAASAHGRLCANWKQFHSLISAHLEMAPHELDSRFASVLARGVGTTLAAARRRTHWSG